MLVWYAFGPGRRLFMIRLSSGCLACIRLVSLLMLFDSVFRGARGYGMDL